MHLQQLRKSLNVCQCICNTSEHHRDRRGACFGQVNRCQLRHRPSTRKIPVSSGAVVPASGARFVAAIMPRAAVFRLSHFSRCSLVRPTTTPFIRHLEPADLAWATAMLLVASDQHPVLRYCCTGPDASAHCAWLVGLLLRFGLHHGRVYADADGLALAIWLSPNNLGATRWPLLRAGLLPAALWRLGWAGLRRLRHHLRAAAKLRAQVVAPGGHHYLLALAVHPAARGQGRGRRLLQATLAAMRATAAVPCYLDTQGAEQLPFFQRMGFRLAGQCLAGPEDNASTTWGLLHASFL